MPTMGTIPFGRQHAYPQQGADLADPVAADKQKQKAFHISNFRQSKELIRGT